jgi:hypothetical protein
MSDNTRDDELGALWEKTSDKGPYMTGSVTIDGIKTDIVVFPNQYKKADNHPSFRILKSRPKEERTSTRRDDKQWQKPYLPPTEPGPGSDSFDSRDRSGTKPAFDPGAVVWPAPGKQRLADRKPDYVKPAKQPQDWTAAVPHPAEEFDSADQPQQVSRYGAPPPVPVDESDIPF